MKKVIQKRQQAERQDRIGKILAAARKLFLEKGYIEATVRDIALEAEFSTGVIYFYFKGKDEIYGRICEEAFHLLLDMIKKAANSSGTPLERLEAVGNAYVRFYIEHPEYFDVLAFRNLGFKKVGLPDEILVQLEQLSHQTISIAHEIVVEGMEQGGINPKMDSWEITFSLWACIEGLIFIHKRNYLEAFNLTLEDLIRNQIRIVLHGIRGG